MVGAVVAFLVSAVVCTLALWGGRAAGFVDRPDAELKTHERPAVPLGGLGVFAGFAVAYWVLANETSWQLVAAAVGIFGLGLADDARSLPPWIRLSAEAVIGGWVGLLVQPTGNIGSDVVVGILVIVLCVNAVNLFDGLDGLAAGSGIVTFVGLAALAWLTDLEVGAAIVSAAALAGFLPFNLPPARLFLGDNGAYLIGVLIGYGILRMGMVDPLGLLVGLTLLGVFGVDLIVTLIRRLAGGRRLFAGDRGHLYDRAVASGVSVGSVAAAFTAIQLGVVTVVVVATASIGFEAGLLAGVFTSVALMLVAWQSNLWAD